MSKISYLLASNRILSLQNEAIQSILTLPKHDYELIICAPENILSESNLENIDNIKLIVDDKCSGAAYGINKSYKSSEGEYISTMTDDITYPTNFLDILDFIKSDFFSQKKFKVVNLMWDGGPGLIPNGHDTMEDNREDYRWPIDKYHPVNILNCPYNVIPLPFLSRDTIENQLNGHIFHPYFDHHYIDHWLGFYICKNETFEPNKWRCPTIRYGVAKVTGMSSSRDSYDFFILKKLTDNFIKNNTPYV